MSNDRATRVSRFPALLIAAAGALAPACGETGSEPARSGTAEADGSSPGPRWGHAFVRDAVRGEVLLFGGTRRRGGPYLGDTWTWDGERWKLHDVDGPPARAMAAAAFHAGRGTVVLQGGRSPAGGSHADTWEWDGSAWSPVEEGGAIAVDHHAMVYVPASDELLLFGGLAGKDVSGATWLFDGAWRRHDGEGPPARSAFGLAYDEERDVAVLAGGTRISGSFGDVWEWADGGWRAAPDAGERSAIDHHSLVWDPVRGQVVGFGGKDADHRLLDALFTIDAGRVAELPSTGGPSARHSTQLAWDGARVLLFGGRRTEGRAQIALDGLWAWDGADWERLDG